LNWGIELIYALQWQKRISDRAKCCIARCHGSHVGIEEAIQRIEQSLLENVAYAVKHSMQLCPFAFHLANISYSGETSGFDRIVGPSVHGTQAHLGILCALFDTWAASSWLRVTLGLQIVGFRRHNEKFRNILDIAISAMQADRFFLQSDDIDKLFRYEESILLPPPFQQLPFSVRSEGDIDRFIDAAETFFSGLAKIFDGEISDFDQLDQWLHKVNFENCEAQRVLQWFSGETSRGRRSAYQQKVRRHKQMFALYRPP
jgi:hypothetical protein